MTELRALAYADWRAFVNDLRAVRRSPGRLVIWIGYVLLLGAFIVVRFVAGRRSAMPAGNADIVRADLFVTALIVTLALSLASGQGAIGIFRSRVEGRFIIGSPIGAPLAIAYLQAREALAQGLRFLFSIVYFVFFFGPKHIGALTTLVDLGLGCAVAAATAAIVVPRRLLSGWRATTCAAAGMLVALAALAPAVRDSVGAFWPQTLPAPVAAGILNRIPNWHPGRILLAPSPGWILVVLVLAAGAIAVLAAAGRDAYPELYALSMARIERIERWRERRGSRGSSAMSRATAAQFVLPAPRGVLVFVWKSVVEFRRRVQLPYIVGGAVLWCAAGFGAARLAASFVATDEAALFATLIGVIINVLLFVGIGAVGTIAGEVRRPLFWLAPAALFERLCALALAYIWRTIVTLELVAVGFALGGGRYDETLVFVAGLPSLAALLAGVGFAVFALFPSAADHRGPVAALRIIASVVLLVPPLVLYIVLATTLDVPLAALAATVLLALIEAGALIGVAAWRLDGSTDRLAA